MGSLISMLATIVLISTVSTLIFAVFAYVASRRPARKKKSGAAEASHASAPSAAGHPVSLQTISLDGVSTSVPMMLVPDVDRAHQLAQGWHVQRHRVPKATVAPSGEALFKTFKVEEDAYASVH